MIELGSALHQVTCYETTLEGAPRWDFCDCVRLWQGGFVLVLPTRTGESAASGGLG